MHVLEQAKALVAEFVGSFEPARYSGSDAQALVVRFDELARLAAAGKVLASRQVTATGAWKQGGYATKEEWYSHTTGTSRSAAAAELATAERVQDLPETDAALRAGKLTSEQAAAVSAAASADPAAEGRLLADAHQRSLSGLKKECQAVRAAAGGMTAATRQQIHASRYFHHWTADDGAFMVKGRMTPEDGARLLAGMTPHRRVVFTEARREGRRESSDAYELDALISLATANATLLTNPPAVPATTGASVTDDPTVGTVPPVLPNGAAGAPAPGAISSADALSGTDPDPPEGAAGAGPPGRKRSPVVTPPAVIVFRLDYPAYLRGFTLPGETCELVGVGPVPVETVRRFASDAVFRIALTDGDELRDLTTLGRNMPTKVRRAVEERDRRCCVPGCERALRLQIHHMEWVSVGGPTRMDNLARVCQFHHDQISYQGAYLAGPHPNWVWYPPGTKPAGIRGWYDPAPPELLDDLGIIHDVDPVTALLGDEPPPGDRLF